MNETYITTELLAQYARRLYEEEKSSATIEKYIRDVHTFSKYVGSQALTKDMTIAYKRDLPTRGYTILSVNSMLASLNSFLTFCGRSDCKVRLYRVQKKTYLAANRELEGIPISIDELKRSVADVPEASLHEAEQGVKDCEGALEAIDAGMAECRMESLQSGAAARLRAAKAELSGYEHRRIAEREAGRRSYMEQRGALERSIRSAQIALEDIEARLKRRIQTAEQNERQRGRLREAYTQVYERTFEPGAVEDRCPACGQALPEEALQAALEHYSASAGVMEA